MTNNDILRHLRFTFDFNDTQMMDLFASAGLSATRAEVCNWLKKDSDPAFAILNDFQLASFLNGLINEKRGKKEGTQPIPEKRLNNNIIFRKLKIALKLTDEDILALLALADMQLSKHELSAFFRKPDQRQYRPCNNQVLRNFLQGLQLKYTKPNTGD